MPWPGRVADVAAVVPDVHFTDGSVDMRGLLERLRQVSISGLAEMYEPRSRSFPHTLRGRVGHRPLVAEGMSVRYTAIAALGLSRVDACTRVRVLAGRDLPDLLPGILGLALAGRDQGALGLSVWASLEVASAISPGSVSTEVDRLSRSLDRLLVHVRTGAPTPTVEHAWTVTALLATRGWEEIADPAGGEEQLAEATQRAAQRLLAAQAPNGLFPHHLPVDRPVDRLGSLRAHVGCFADQVYPIHALTRYAEATGDAAALEAAARCADRLVALQGEQGQWWWHYDWRHGTVLERYPVYSVHQHALAPMALLAVREAGGPDHRHAVAAGLGWLAERPESPADLIADDLGVVWRKVGRHEPRKAVRKIRSAASASDRAVRLAWLDWIFPPGSVDRECRPFELGWLLYAWSDAWSDHSPDGSVGIGPSGRLIERPHSAETVGESS